MVLVRVTSSNGGLSIFSVQRAKFISYISLRPLYEYHKTFHPLFLGCKWNNYVTKAFKVFRLFIFVADNSLIKLLPITLNLTVWLMDHLGIISANERTVSSPFSQPPYSYTHQSLQQRLLFAYRNNIFRANIFLSIFHEAIFFSPEESGKSVE